MCVQRELHSDALRVQCTRTCSAHACTRPAVAAYQLGAYAVHVQYTSARNVFASARLLLNYLRLATCYLLLTGRLRVGALEDKVHRGGLPLGDPAI